MRLFEKRHAPSDTLNEQLPTVASLARALSSVTCAPGDGVMDCGAHHGIWPYLRLLGLAKSMSGMSAEFIEALREVGAAWAKETVGSQVRAVLVSACVDHTALAHVLHAMRGLPRQPEVTVLDRCPTPLVLARWYAQREEWAIRTVCADVLQHDAVAAYDLLLTSSFLGYFSPDQRTALFAAWARMLRPGGFLVFSNRLRPGPEDQRVSYSVEQAAALAAQVALLAPGLPPEAALPASLARELAHRFARAMSSYPVNGEESLRRLAAQAGLVWHEVRHKRSAVACQGLSGPTLSDGAPYVLVTLRKPG